ncbi:hypothetical protein [Ekhidna sp.]
MKATHAKIGIYYNRMKKHYELKTVAFNYNEFDPNLKWVFDHSKYELAVKVQHSMNQ